MTEPLHLLLEHTEADVELCLAELERGGFKVRADVVKTRADFEARIRPSSYDVVLADYRLPDWTGMGALAVLQEYRRERGCKGTRGYGVSRGTLFFIEDEAEPAYPAEITSETLGS